MKRFYLVFLCLVACLLSGCFIVPSLKDPFGAYEAKVTINDRNALARETIASYDRDARMVEAEQAADAKVNMAQAWAGMIPNVALILAACVITVVFIHWHGRIILARLAWGEPPLGPRALHMAQPNFAQLKELAARRNQDFKVVNGVALLIDRDTGEVVKRRLLTR